MTEIVIYTAKDGHVQLDVSIADETVWLSMNQTGIQLLRAGRPELGKRLIEKALGAEAGHHRSRFRSPAGEDPVLIAYRYH